MQKSATFKMPINKGLETISENQIVVLNVVGSSPTGHPKKTSPKGTVFFCEQSSQLQAKSL